MKKLLFAVLFAVLALPMFTSCDSSEAKCYNVKFELVYANGSTTTTVDYYIWASKDELDASIDKQKAAFEKLGATVTVKSKTVSKEYDSVALCSAANLPK